MDNRKQFKCYRSYWEIAKEIPNKEDRADYLMALCEYQFTGLIPELTGMAKFAFLSQKHSLDKQLEGFLFATKTQEPQGTPVEDTPKGVHEGYPQGIPLKETPIAINNSKEIIVNTKEEINKTKQTIDVPTKVETPPKKKVLFTECSMLDFEPEKQKAFEIAKGFWQLFGANLKEIGAPLVNIKKADAKEWTRQIALMLKNKEATVDQLREVYDFLKVDEFWKPNVQSVPKLREKFTTIYSQSKKPKNGTNSTGGLSEEGKLRILEKLASGARFQEEQRQKHASQMPNE
jgi:hypothetical protein